jgi:hypothetical protein
MSHFIKTRSSSQCRTYYQSLARKEGDIESALQGFIEGHPHFLERYETVKDLLRIQEDIDFSEDTSTVVRNCKAERLEECPTAIADDETNPRKETNLNFSNVIIPEIYKPSVRVVSNNFLTLLSCQALFRLWVNKLQYLMSLSN